MKIKTNKTFKKLLTDLGNYCKIIVESRCNNIIFGRDENVGKKNIKGNFSHVACGTDSTAASAVRWEPLPLRITMSKTYRAIL